MSIDFQCNKHHFQDWLLYSKSWVWIELHSSVVEVYNVLNNKVVHWLVCLHTSHTLECDASWTQPIIKQLWHWH